MIKKNFIYSIALTIAQLLFPIISFPYATRILGPEGIGLVQFVITFAQYFVLVAGLGIPIYGIREISKAKNDKVQLNKLFSELLLINIISTIVMLGIYITILVYSNKFESNRSFFVWGALVVLGGFLSMDWFFAGLEEFKYITYRSVLIKTISMILLFFFVKTERDTLNYLLITIFSLLGNNIWNLLSLKEYVNFDFHKLNIIRHISPLLILFSTSISTSIYTLMDTLLLGFLGNNIVVGYYTAAIKIIKIIIPVVASLGIVLIPKITYAISINDTKSLIQLVNKSFSFICFLSIPICVGFILYASEIIRIFSGDSFALAAITMQMASPIVFFIGLGHLFGLQILIPSGNEKSYLYATIGGMLISIALNFVLIPIFHDKGAAISMLAGEICVSSLSYYFIHKKMNISFDWKLILYACVTSLIFIPIKIIIDSLNLSIYGLLIMGCSTSFIFYVLIQYFIFKSEIVHTSLSYLCMKIKLTH